MRKIKGYDELREKFHKWHYNENHSHFDWSIGRYKVLKQQGFYPRTAIDIGANIGQWYGEFDEIFPDTEVLSVEGNPACENELKQVNPNYLISFLGKEKKEQTFFLNENNLDKSKGKTCAGASFYKENTEMYNDCIEHTISTDTLDSLGQTFDLIKIDVQGAELDVIKGGLHTILDCSVLQLELAVLEFNDGAPLMGEIISYLHNINFSVYDITSHHYWETPGVGDRLNQADLMFINRTKLKTLLQLEKNPS